MVRTAVTGEGDEGGIVYNRALIDLARHYGFHPRACRPYRAKTKGKVERPFRYIRQDFFLARTFRNLEDLNDQLRRWLNEVANPRIHATTGRVVNEAFAEERAFLKPLPLAPFRAVLRLERRISRDGMVSVGGNFYKPAPSRSDVVTVSETQDGTLQAAGGAGSADQLPVRTRQAGWPMLTGDEVENWLTGKAGKEVLRPAAESALREWVVSSRVNKTGAFDDDATLIEPLAA